MKTKEKFLTVDQVFELFDLFIRESTNGKRLKKNGKHLRPRTVAAYHITKKRLYDFIQDTGYVFKVFLPNKLTKREKEFVKRYWKKFFKKFTDYLYYDCNYFDNYVGKIIKTLRLFFGYLNDEKDIFVGHFYKSFYSYSEKIPIVVLNPEHLHYLIYDNEFNTKLSPKMKSLKDIFIFGCSVALRYSDIMALNKNSLQYYNSGYYLQADSIKTGTHTNIKLPDYAVEILERWKEKKKMGRLFPYFAVATFNNYLKELGKLMNLTEPFPKYRHKRGEKVLIYRNKAKREHFTVADHLSSHTMRRTAITTMLRLGMPEHMVRKISGHAPNSIEFERYVSFAQSYIDEHTEKVFDKIKNLKLNPIEKTS